MIMAAKLRRQLVVDEPSIVVGPVMNDSFAELTKDRSPWRVLPSGGENVSRMETGRVEGNRT